MLHAPLRRGLTWVLGPMPDIIYILLSFVGVIAFAATLLKVGELARRYLKIKGLPLYLLAAAGFLLSGLGWEGYAKGQVTFWQALGGTVFLAGLPLWVALWLIIPDLLHSVFGLVARLFRKQAR